MSTSKGNIQRTRAQKHQNKTKFRNDLHDSSHKQKMINSIRIAEVCDRCVAVIEWKRQYRKYKPLTQPKTCNKCGNRSVRQAYHVLCTPCAVASRQCAKCLVSADEANILPPNKSEAEEIKEKAQIDRLLKKLPERRRRTFLRYLRKKSGGGKKKKAAAGDGQDNDDDDDEEEAANEKQNVEAVQNRLKQFITAADLNKQEMDLVKMMEEKMGFLWDLDASDKELSDYDSEDLDSDDDVGDEGDDSDGLDSDDLSSSASNENNGLVK